jgi:hypothetical protein
LQGGAIVKSAQLSLEATLYYTFSHLAKSARLSYSYLYENMLFLSTDQLKAELHKQNAKVFMIY